jgi:hypothetical protein
VKFQLPSMLARVARELLEAASLVAERIAGPSERQSLEEKIAKLRSDVELQVKVTELWER